MQRELTALREAQAGVVMDYEARVLGLFVVVFVIVVLCCWCMISGGMTTTAPLKIQPYCLFWSPLSVSVKIPGVGTLQCTQLLRLAKQAAEAKADATQRCEGLRTMLEAKSAELRRTQHQVCVGVVGKAVKPMLIANT